MIHSNERPASALTDDQLADYLDDYAKLVHRMEQQFHASTDAQKATMLLASPFTGREEVGIEIVGWAVASAAALRGITDDDESDDPPARRHHGSFIPAAAWVAALPLLATIAACE